MKIWLLSLLLVSYNMLIYKAIGVEVEPAWKRMILGIGYMLVGGAVVYFLAVRDLRKIVKESAESKQGCSHPCCLAKQKPTDN